MGQYTYDHPRPCVTVDVAILTEAGGELKVLLIRRKRPPFLGKWAIPGGFVEMEESLDEAARRELHEETGVSDVVIEQLHTFGAPDRDPRGRTITVAYLAEVASDRIPIRAGDDAAEAAWHPMDRLPELAFDHDEILSCARKRFEERKKRRTEP